MYRRAHCVPVLQRGLAMRRLGLVIVLLSALLVLAVWRELLERYIGRQLDVFFNATFFMIYVLSATQIVGYLTDHLRLTEEIA
jgi:hypothetical protein